MYFKNNDAKVLKPAEGVVIKVVGYGGPLMATEVSFEKGAQGPTHSHSNEQLSYIAKGSCEFTVGDKSMVVKEGDSVYIPGDISHGVNAIEETLIIDIFTPQREDFK